MAEALWVQASGVSYSAQEDRQLIHAIFTDGVISGLVLLTGSGLNVNVSAGLAAISDSSGYGSYLGVLDATTPVAVTANTTSTIYLTVNPTTGQCTLASGSAPSNPYLTLGSATAGPSTVTSVTGASSRTKSFFRSGGGSEFILKAGDSDIGTLNNVQSLSVLGAAYFESFLTGYYGIRLGGASGYLKRANARVTGGAQNLPASTLTPITFGTIQRNISDYSSSLNPAIISGGFPDRFYAPVSGVYELSGSVGFTSTVTTGVVYTQIGIYDSSGSVVRYKYQPAINANSGVASYVPFSALVEMTATQYAKVLCFTTSARTTNAANTIASCCLLQVD